MFWILNQSVHRINYPCIYYVHSSETQMANGLLKWQFPLYSGMHACTPVLVTYGCTVCIHACMYAHMHACMRTCTSVYILCEKDPVASKGAMSQMFWRGMYIVDVRLTDKLDYFFISWVQVHSEVPPISICLIKVDLYSCGTSSTHMHLCNTTCTCGECIIHWLHGPCLTGSVESGSNQVAVHTHHCPRKFEFKKSPTTYE